MPQKDADRMASSADPNQTALLEYSSLIRVLHSLLRSYLYENIWEIAVHVVTKVIVFSARHFMKQILEGMLYLHSYGILHRDLTLANLLLTRDMDVVSILILRKNLTEPC